MTNSKIRCGKIEKDSIGNAIQFFCEAIAADVAMLNGDRFTESVILEFFSCLLNSWCVKVECVEMTGFLDGSEEIMRK